MMQYLVVLVAHQAQGPHRQVELELAARQRRGPHLHLMLEAKPLVVELAQRPSQQYLQLIDLFDGP